MRFSLGTDTQERILKCSREHLKEQELQTLRPQLTSTRYQYHSYLSLLNALRTAPISQLNPTPKQSIKELIDSKAETYKVRIAYRKIQKQLLEYTNDKSFYDQYLLFDNHEQSLAVFSAKIKSAIEGLNKDVLALQKQYQEISTRIKVIHETERLTNNWQLLATCYQQAVESIQQQLHHEAQTQLVYLGPTVTSVIIKELLANKSEYIRSAIAESAHQPFKALMQSLETRANNLWLEISESYRHLDCVLTEIYQVKQKLIDTTNSKSMKFDLCCQIEDIIVDSDLAASKKIDSVHQIFKSPDFLNNFSREKGFIKFYEKTSQWSPGFFNLKLPAPGSNVQLAVYSITHSP